MMTQHIQILVLVALFFASVSKGSVFPPLETSTDFQCSPLPEVACSGLFPIRPATENRIALLTDGETSLAARVAMLKKAKRSIRIQALIFTGDESGLLISEILKAKKREGLDVRVIVDSWSNLSGSHIASKILGWQTQWMYYDLKQHGIEVEGYESLFFTLVNELDPKDPLKTNMRYHEKLWLIDGEDPETRQAVIGGMNIANEYFRANRKSTERWRDQDLYVKGSVVEDMVTAFDRNFNYFKNIKKSKPDLFDADKAWNTWASLFVRTFGRLKIPFIQNSAEYKKVRELIQNDVLPEGSPAKVRFFQNRPRLKETYIRQAYLQMIGSASQIQDWELSEVLIANAYFLPRRDLREAIKNAREQKVDVSVLTNSLESNDLPALSYVSRYFYKELMDQGVDIYEWIGAKANQGTLHAKYAVFNRQAAIIGSYNLDPRSDLLNSESALIFENTEVALALAKQFYEVDIEKARKVTPAEAARYRSPKDIQGKFNLMFSLPFTDWL